VALQDLRCRGRAALEALTEEETERGERETGGRAYSR